MENISNSKLLYDVIDSLSDEEFKDLVDTLSISDKVDAVKETEVEVDEKVDYEARKKALKERLDTMQKKKAIQEKITAMRRKAAIKEGIDKDTKLSEEDKLRLKIKEKLEVSRRKKAIQERVANMKNK